MDDPELDDKKPFGDDAPADDGDEPVPDEVLEFTSGDGRIWLAKIPKVLMEIWQSVAAPNVHLATIRVHNDSLKDNKPHISLLLPDSPRLGADALAQLPYRISSTAPLTREYDLSMVNSLVKNHLVVSERDLDPPKGRAKSSHFLGNVIHECTVRPSFSNTYRETVAERNRAANQPKRQTVYLTKDDVKGGTGALNKLSSGSGNTNTFNDKFVQPAKKPGKEFERFARMPRDQLLDILFSLFEESPTWSFKEIRSRTEQPAEYLKEILALVAVLHRSGEYNGQYTLLDNFKTDQNRESIKHEEGPSASPNVPIIKRDEQEDYDEEDDDDMEEIN